MSFTYRLQKYAVFYAVLDTRMGTFVKKYDGGFTYHTQRHATARANAMNKYFNRSYRDETDTRDPYVVVSAAPEWKPVE